MKLKNNSLEAEFAIKCGKPGHGLPANNKAGYETRYASIKQYMNSYIHPNVVPGAMIEDGGFLTDHGPEHIATVIARASNLLTSSRCKVSTYEMYILLCSIHFHDAGNAYGRKGHEKLTFEIIDSLGALVGPDQAERRAIAEISRAHGGYTDEGDKDTIGRLQVDLPLLGENVRQAYLAAVLRFADELADDTHRASRYLVENRMIPKSSEVFHMYALRLQSVIVRADDGSVDLLFDLCANDVINKFGKAAGEVFLLDEIFERTVKMHYERVYCRQFMLPDIDIRTINVKIDIYDNNFHEKIRSISYQLKDRGYPSDSVASVHQLAPELKSWNSIEDINGEKLSLHISANQE